MIRSRAAVAWAAGQPLDITEIDVTSPQHGEVLLKIVATGVCHTDAYTLSGADPEGLFPAVLGHEGGAVVVEVGEGITSVKCGDHVIPTYTPECAECSYCRSGKTNLYRAIRTNQGQGSDKPRNCAELIASKSMPIVLSSCTINQRQLRDHYTKTTAISQF